MSEQEGKLAAIIPDFFFELISRIAPGFVVIALSLYWAGSDFKSPVFTLGLSVFLLAAAWIIGVTLDVGLYSIWKILLGGRGYCIGGKHRDDVICCIKEMLHPAKSLPPVKGGDGDARWQYLRKSRSWERGRMIKAEAQLIFFRNMMSVCALTAVICFIIEPSPELDSLLPVLHSHRCLYGKLAIFSLLFVFFPSWGMMKWTLEKEWKRLLNMSETNFEI